MMKKLVPMLLAATVCDAPGPRLIVAPGNVVTPGGSYSLASSFSQALQCPVEQLAWSIPENAPPNPPGSGGAIDAAGNFTAPPCGSAYVGSSVHVVATGCGQTATAAISVVEDLLGLTLAGAIVTNPGQPACLAADPRSPVVRPGGTIAFHARLSFTCREVAVPGPLPSPLPAICP